MKLDIVVTCSGGVITGVFGPENATVLVIDYDNLKEGDLMPEVCGVDGTPDCKVCLELIQEAKEIAEQNKEETEAFISDNEQEIRKGF